MKSIEQYLKSLEDDIRKGLGMAPYNTPSNLLAGDMFFWTSLQNKYNKEDIDKMVKKLRKQLVKDAQLRTPPIPVSGGKGTGFNKGERVRVVVEEGGVDLYGTFDRMLVFGTALVCVDNCTCQISAPVGTLKRVVNVPNHDACWRLWNRVSKEVIFCETQPNQHDWDWDLWELRPPVTSGRVSYAVR